MKAIRYHKFGTPEVLVVEDVDNLIIDENEVLVEVYSTTINSGDCHLRSGKPYMARLFAGPFVPRNKILGTTFSGKIVEVGSKIEKYRVGDEIFGSFGLKSGTHAEFIKIVEDGAFVKKPKDLSHEEAASLVFGSLSAKYFLDKAGIKKKQSVLIIGAAGGVGSYAVQYAKAKGATVTGVCRGTNEDFVKDLGASAVIDYKNDTLNNYKNKYDIILDTVGKEDISVIKSCLTTYGVYVTTMVRTDVVFRELFNKYNDKKYIFGLDNNSALDLSEILQLVKEDLFKPLIDKIYKINEVQEAHNHVETKKKSGAVVLNIKK